MQLSYKKYGEGAPLIILHGLYGSSDNWVSVGKQLSELFEVFIVDQRNHGKSPHHPDMTYLDMQNDLAEFIEQHDIERPVLLGHSMGGKTAMHYAVKNPYKINKLIVADISPRSYIQGEYTPQMGKHFDLIRSMLSVDFEMADSREDIDEQLAVDIKETRIRQFLQKNLTRTKDGYKWRINIWAISNNLKRILEGIDKIEFEKPVDSFRALFLKGEKSDYIQEVDEKMIHEYFSEAKIETIADAGHWMHAEQSEVFLSAVENFLIRE